MDSEVLNGEIVDEENNRKGKWIVSSFSGDIDDGNRRHLNGDTSDPRIEREFPPKPDSSLGEF